MQCNNEMTMQVSSVTVIFFFDILSLVQANVHIRHLRTEWLWVDFFKRALKHKNKIMERWDIVINITQMNIRGGKYKCIKHKL